MSLIIKWLDHNSNTVFAFIAALANITLWVMAGEMAEGLTPLARVSSASLGVAMSFGIWGIFRKTAGLQLTIKGRGKVEREIPNPRFWLPASAGGFVMVVEVALLSAVIVAKARGVTLNALMPGGWLWAWAAGRVISAALVLVALAITAGAKKDDGKPAQVAIIAEPKPVKVDRVAPKKISKPVFVAWLRQNSGASDDDIAQHFGISRQAVNSRRKTITPAELGLVTK